MPENKGELFEKKTDSGGNDFWIIPKGYDDGAFKHNCFIRRIPKNILSLNGHYCGYVEIKPGEPFYGVGTFLSAQFNVHGGITYANRNESFDQSGTNWYLGFDCNHTFDDYDPKDFNYVLEQLRFLSYQLYYYTLHPDRINEQ
jgi:hypothetical protein